MTVLEKSNAFAQDILHRQNKTKKAFKISAIVGGIVVPLCVIAIIAILSYSVKRADHTINDVIAKILPFLLVPIGICIAFFFSLLSQVLNQSVKAAIFEEHYFTKEVGATGVKLYLDSVYFESSHTSKYHPYLHKKVQKFDSEGRTVIVEFNNNKTIRIAYPSLKLQFTF